MSDSLETKARCLEAHLGVLQGVLAGGTNGTCHHCQWQPNLHVTVPTPIGYFVSRKDSLSTVFWKEFQGVVYVLFTCVRFYELFSSN